MSAQLGPSPVGTKQQLGQPTMSIEHLRFGKRFSVAKSGKRAQAATMVIAREGGPHHKHRGADQRLFIVPGSGIAVLGGRR